VTEDFHDELDEQWDDDEPDDYEPIGSCDECNINVYEDDVHFINGLILCDHCAYRMTAP
jgi:formylmethanofuran dehydrogenase subunit E